MLVVKNLHASIQGKAILKGFDLTIHTGEVHAIMGQMVQVNLRFQIFLPGVPVTN